MNKVVKIFFFPAIILFIYSLFCIDSAVDNDLWHRFAVGEIFWQIGTVLKHDIFAYTPVKELWIDHEWGTGVIFYTLTKLFGDFGLIFLNLAAFFAVFLLVYFSNKEKGSYLTKLIFYIISILAIYAGFQNFVRSQIFTYLFFALWIFLLEKIRNSNINTAKYNLKYLITFPSTMLLWVNLHGGFLSGVGLVLIYAIGELLNRKKSFIYLIILLLILPVTLINPYGFEYIKYIYTAATMNRQHITEWQPLNLMSDFFSNLAFKILLIITSIGWVNRLLIKAKSIDWTELILIAVTLSLSFKYQRHLVFFAIVSSVFGYKYFQSLVNFIKLKFNYIIKNSFLSTKAILLSFAFQVFLLIFVIGFGISTIISKPLKMKINPNKYPVTAIEFIKINNLKGNLLVPFNWGSYVLWKLYPVCKVSIDGRYEETYSDELFKEMLVFYNAESAWFNILNKYNTDIILLPKESNIYKKISILKNWKLVYYDKYSAVFVKSDFPNRYNKKPAENIDYSKTKYNVPAREYADLVK